MTDQERDDLRNLAARELGDLGDMFGTPEPPPVADGAAVTPSLIEWFDQTLAPSDAGFCIGAVEARSEFGQRKYGQVLRTGDGRNTGKEAAQELADFLQYAHKFRMQKPNQAEIRRFLRINGPLLRATRLIFGAIEQEAR
jgi:hypothetical protein